MNKTENVRTQYADDKNLAVRSRLHTLYSTNRQGLISWLFEQYDFTERCQILELGCGNASQWDNRADKLPSGAGLVLSDFSEGMVSIVRSKYDGTPNVKAEQVDIQSIPYEDDLFDVVIANHMLYHVPDIDKGLSEIRRVLRPNGVFYATTNGNGGMRIFLRKVFLTLDSSSTAFTQTLSFSTQNGADILKRRFSQVEYRDYPDSLEITNTNDLMEWISSTITIATYSEEQIAGLFDYFESIRQRDGAIRILKECGLFVCGK